MNEIDIPGLVGAATAIFDLVIAEEMKTKKQLLKDWLRLPLALRSGMGDYRAKAIDLQTMNSDQITPRLWDMVGDLVDTVLRKAPPQERAKWLEMPLECAVRSGNLDLVVQLLAVGGLAQRVGGVRYCEFKPSTLLHMAITTCASHFRGNGEDNAELVVVLIQNGALLDIDRRVWGLYNDELSWSTIKEVWQAPLHRAVYYGLVNVVEVLIKEGAPLDMFDSAGFTPLSIALEQKRHDIAWFLLFCGASPHAKIRQGSPALHLAITGKRSCELAALMIKGGVDIEATNAKGHTALHVACANGGSISLVACIVAANADVNARDENGDTPLMVACRHCSSKVVSYLLRHGADDTLSNRLGLVAGVESASPPGTSESQLTTTGEPDRVRRSTLAVLAKHRAWKRRAWLLVLRTRKDPGSSADGAAGWTVRVPPERVFRSIVLCL